MFALTTAERLSRSDAPGGSHDFARVFGHPLMLRGRDHLEDGPRTGETGLDTVYGTPFFDHPATRPELSRQVNSAMSQATRLTAAQLPDHHDFGGFQHVVDVGGGDGTLLASVPRRFRTPRGTVHDRADGLAQAPDKLAEPGLTGRCELAVGDFFASVPAGADLYLIT